jgi:putative ABC transport system substrate-binding protein
MRRREFMAGAIFTTLARRASAETSGAVRRLAIFEPAIPAASWRRGTFGGEAMLEQLNRHKYVEGDNLKIEIYGTEANVAGLEALAKSVVATNPDVIFVGGVGGPFVQRATDTIPIVVLSSDLVGQGLVKSLSHPGGNITGVAADTGPLIWGKRIGLLREMVPSMSKLAFLGLSQSTLVRPVQVPAVEAAAAAQGVALVVVTVVAPAPEADYRAAVESARRQGADSLLVGQNPQTDFYAPLLADLTAEARLPAIYPWRSNVEAGGLMAYWEDFADLSRRCGAAIAAILDGAKPADIPVEQPSRHFLTINLKTARALGLDPPPTLLAAAEDVIE